MARSPLKLIGERFGKLVVKAEHDKRNKQGQIHWICQCDCGNTVVALGTSLKEGRKKSCGCILRTNRTPDLTGRRLGKFTIIEKVEKQSGRNVSWLCMCDCGNTVIARGTRLNSGKLPRCSCLVSNSSTRKSIGKSKSIHGQSRSKIYFTWNSMLMRCCNHKSQYYAIYGGRGITVCERWRIFENFRDDMGERPKGKSLDRIDNDGPYSPENCRWATKQEQSENRRCTRWITVDGRDVTLRTAAKITGVSYRTILRRVSKGLPNEEVLKPTKK